MSSSNGRSRIRDRGYGDVPGDSPYRDESCRTLATTLRDRELAVSSDPLPPPPLPLQPPFGPGCYSSDTEEEEEPPSSAALGPHLKPVRRFIPDSWKNFFRGRRKTRREPAWDKSVSDLPYISDGVECSPPASPARLNLRAHGSCGDSTARSLNDAMLVHGDQVYGEQVHRYELRYAYMKSWPGLLRILAAAQLLLGAGVFACVTAYIHKDSEWYNLFGYSQPYGLGGVGSLGSAYGGYYYGGPKTPFVLVVAGLAWVTTIILLVLGMSMYYRTILLDSNWWPLTEFAINVSLFILYMAAAIVYVNDTNRGGLCYYPLFNTPMNAVFCRVEGGQIAAMIFLFVTMILYLVSALVCLKLWRHEAARRHREYLEQQEVSDHGPSVLFRFSIIYISGYNTPETTPSNIPSARLPPPKLPPVGDQALKTHEFMGDEHERISRIHEEFKKKKNDPSFLEKKERCEYLKNKLSHIKQRIQEYDKIMNWDIQGY
uniref:MARVEL (membrane-associating) domain containing 2 n=1 Tax=Jaculus jaculus TaxID=51337 RepID=A0A8C5JY94_JACJA